MLRFYKHTLANCTTDRVLYMYYHSIKFDVFFFKNVIFSSILPNIVYWACILSGDSWLCICFERFAPIYLNSFANLTLFLASTLAYKMFIENNFTSFLLDIFSLLTALDWTTISFFPFKGIHHMHSMQAHWVPDCSKLWVLIVVYTLRLILPYTIITRMYY